MIHDCFGHDQHEAVIHQLFHIHQVGSITKYVEQFSALVDQLATYESNANHLYHAMIFADGLCGDIKSMVMILCPPTLDSTCVLALVQ
jgi:hypothetical protein